MTVTDLQRHIDRADLCVMCGQCLPHCPTFDLSHNEAESPRGRISLINALERGDIDASEATLAHLDNCLLCRACEKVCPSRVPFGEIMAAARDRYRSKQTHGLLQAMALGGEHNGKLLPLLRLYQRSGLQKVVRTTHLLGNGKLARLESLLPPLANRHERQPSATGGGVNAVYLFRGCSGESLDGETLDTARQLLSLSGFRVIEPDASHCCGALNLHRGQSEQALDEMAHNLELFADTDIPVVTLASGCAATLLDHSRWIEGEEAEQFSQRVFELGDFLQRHARWPHTPARLTAPVAIHTPCSQRNVVRRPDSAQQLLSQIPGLESWSLQGGCCGAAGDYMVSHPETADALATPLLEQLAARRTELLVTSNVGCALHLAAAARRNGQRLEVIHPATLLLRQIKAAGEAPLPASAHQV